MLTYSGSHITKEYGAPSLRDIAVQTMRLPRFCGASELFYPVGMHLLLVAALVPPELEHHALLHDAPEACVNDVPRPMKTPQAKQLEHAVLVRIYDSLGLALPTHQEDEAIHAADIRAVNVEGRNNTGPRGFAETQPNIDYEDKEAEAAFTDLMLTYNPVDAINPNGHWPLLLERKLRRAIRRSQKITLVESYTKPA